MNLTEFEKVKAHPFHKYLGINEVTAENGTATIELTIASHILNPPGTLHGGVLYTICDICCFCALISTLEEKEIGVTNHFSTQVMLAAQPNDTIIFKAQIIKKGKRLAFLECTAFCNEKILAKASITKTLLHLP